MLQITTFNLYNNFVMKNIISKIKHADHDKLSLGGIARHQIYKPNLKSAFDLNKNITFAFEGGTILRLLRLLNGRRTMDFIVYANFENNEVFVENSNSGQATIMFESIDDFKELISSLPCYPNYDRSHNDVYTPQGDQMSKSQILQYINTKINIKS